MVVVFNDLVGHQTDESALGRAGHTPGIGALEVASHAAAIVAATAVLVVHLRPHGIGIGHARRGGTLQADKQLQSPAVGVEVAAVLRVAVTIARSGETVARIVDNHRAKDYLVTAVHVDIGNTEVVEAIAKPGRFAVVAVPAPALGQLVGCGIHVKYTELMARVAATA